MLTVLRCSKHFEKYANANQWKPARKSRISAGRYERILSHPEAGKIDEFENSYGLDCMIVFFSTKGLKDRRVDACLARARF